MRPNCDELLRRLAHPFWFQSFGAVMGMDWHSSGITTSVIAALKRGLAPLSNELGIHVCGGRGSDWIWPPMESGSALNLFALLGEGDTLGGDFPREPLLSACRAKGGSMFGALSRRRRACRH
jgi:hypothetical protein